MRKLPYVVTFSDGTKWKGRAHHVFVARVSGNQVRGLHYMDIAIKVEDQTYEFRGDIFNSGLTRLNMNRAIMRGNPRDTSVFWVTMSTLKNFF